MAFGRDNKPGGGVVYPEAFRKEGGASSRQRPSGGYIASMARSADPQWQLVWTILESSTEPQVILDSQMCVVAANPPAAELVGLAAHEMAGRCATEFLLAEVDGLFGEELADRVDGAGRWTGRGQVLCHDGDALPAQIGLHLVNGEHGTLDYVVVVLRTAGVPGRAKGERNAFFLDTTTGLPRWSLLRTILQRRLKAARTSGVMLAVLVLELRNARRVSQTHGHEMGRQIRAQVARRIQALVGEEETLSRLSGDTFGLVLSGVTSVEQATARARQILETLRDPFPMRGEDIFLQADVGVAVHPQHGVEADELLRNAEVALEHARQKDAGGFRLYTAEMHQDACRRAAVESSLHYALARGELQLYYQPQVHPQSGRIVGAEVLLRWLHPEWGFVSPNTFVPIAEETGLIVDIGAWLLRMACRQYESWLLQGLRLPKLSVNVSAQQIRGGQLLSTVREVLADVDIFGGSLELELTESIIMDDAPETLAVMEELRRLGVRTAIDDFGTGYSSLAYLRRFPTDVLKIDRSFVMGLPDDRDSEVIVRTIVQMAATLGLGIVAEGVETREQLKYIQQQGIAAVQGFIFARPVPAREFSEMLQQGRLVCRD